jgi:hypothetical protein
LYLTYIISYFDTYNCTHNGDEPPKEMERVYCAVRTESLMKFLSWDRALDFFIFITKEECVYCTIRTEILTIIQINFSSCDLAMAQAVSFRSHTAEARFRCPVNSCEICCGRSGNGSGSSLSTWVFVVSIILPIPQTHLHLDSFVRMTEGDSSEYSKDQ